MATARSGALIYQHTTDDRDQEIGKALNALIQAERWPSVTRIARMTADKKAGRFRGWSG